MLTTIKMLKRHNLKLKYIIHINQEPSQSVIEKILITNWTNFVASSPSIMDLLKVKKLLQLAFKQPAKKLCSWCKETRPGFD